MNVADAVSIGDNTLSVFRRSLPSGFHAKMSSPVKTMDYLKRGVKMGEKTVFDAESIFLRTLPQVVYMCFSIRPKSGMLKDRN